MGGISKLVGGLFGGKTPKVSTKAIDNTKNQKEEAKKARQALYGTDGGAGGATLSPDQVSGRNTLLGN